MDSPMVYGALGLGTIALFYWYRAERVRELKRAQASSQSQREQISNSSKFPFTTIKKRLWDPSSWKVNDAGWAREGQYGMERRDYIDPVSGTHVVTHTDQWVNV